MENGTKYITLTIFTWTLGIIIASMITISGFLYNVAIEANDRARDNQVLIASVQTQLVNISETLLEIKNELRR